MSKHYKVIRQHGYTEIFDYYKDVCEDNSFGIPFDNESGTKPNELSYIASVSYDLKGRDVNITVPEEIDGMPVVAVSIIPQKTRKEREEKYEHSTPKHIYIHSNVRHIFIDTLIVSVVNQYYYELYNILDRCTVEISPDNPYFRVYNNAVYSKDMTVLYYIFSPHELPDGGFEVPGEVRRIRSGTGTALKGLRRLVISESVENIEKDAFHSCYDLEEAEICAKIIESEAFSQCHKLKAARISSKRIGERAFLGCVLLQTLELANTKVMSEKAFSLCDSLSEVRLPDTLLSIGDEVFTFSKIHKLTIPKSVKKLGEDILAVTHYEYRLPNGGLSSESDALKAAVDPETMEIYINGDLSVPFTYKKHLARGGTLVVARSRETEKVLFEYVIMAGKFDPDPALLTGGFDFKQYDEFLLTDSNHYGNIYITCSAALARLRVPFQMDSKKTEEMRSFAEKRIEELIGKSIILDKTTAADIAEFEYIEFIGSDALLRLIDLSAAAGRTEITAVLMQKMNERRTKS